MKLEDLKLDSEGWRHLPAGEILELESCNLEHMDMKLEGEDTVYYNESVIDTEYEYYLKPFLYYKPPPWPPKREADDYEKRINEWLKRSAEWSECQMGSLRSRLYDTI